MKNKFKIITALIIGVIMGTLGYVVADNVASIINANQVGYSNSDKTQKTDVQGAIDELYEHANTYCPKRNPYSITNLIQDGSFEASINRWNDHRGGTVSQSNANKSYGTYSLLSSTASNYVEATYVYVDNNNNYYNFAAKPNDKYYCQVKYYSTSSSVEIIFMNNDLIFHGMGYPNSSWNLVSVYATNNQNNNNFILRLDNNNNNQNANVYFDGVLCVNLTDTFGSGNEPDKEWCDENITYFDGTTIIYK